MGRRLRVMVWIDSNPPNQGNRDHSALEATFPHLPSSISPSKNPSLHSSLHHYHLESESLHPRSEIISGLLHLASEGGEIGSRMYYLHLLALTTLANAYQEACESVGPKFFLKTCLPWLELGNPSTIVSRIHQS